MILVLTFKLLKQGAFDFFVCLFLGFFVLIFFNATLLFARVPHCVHDPLWFILLLKSEQTQISKLGKKVLWPKLQEYAQFILSGIPKKGSVMFFLRISYKKVVWVHGRI